MRKRLLSILVACCMVLTMIPVTVFATETEGTAAPAASEGDALVEGLEGLGADLEEQLGEQPEEPRGQLEEQPEQPEDRPGQLEDQPEAKPAAEEQAAQPAPQAIPSAGEPVVLNDEDESALGNAAEKEVGTADELTAAIADSAVTTVKLAANIDFSGTLTVTARVVTLDLNGFTLKSTNPDQIPITTYGRYGTYTDNYPIGILVNSRDDRRGQLTLADSSEAATGRLEMTGVKDTAIFVTDGELTMTGGTITNSYSGGIGGSLYMTGIVILRGTAAMTGGKIEKQKQMGVWVCASTFTMGGNAVISGCGTAAGTVSSAGGGVLVNYNCVPYGKNDAQRTIIPSYFTLEGGAKIENCAAKYGGGVSVQDNCLFSMTGGSITGCAAYMEGGGVATEGYGPGSTSEDEKPVFTMTGGSISDCKAGDTYGGTGGGVSVGAMFGGMASSFSMFEMIGGTITGCKATNGGGVNIQASSSFTMTNGSISDCEALLGGGVELRQARIGIAPTVFTMSGGSITGCKAVDATDASGGLGGGVYMGSGCQLAMSGNARITGCEAARSGSGIYGTNDASSPWQVPLLTRSDNAQVDKGVSMDYALQVGSGVTDFQTVRMDGLGTEAYPYEIGTADQLKLFRQIVNGVQATNEAAVLPPQNLGACAVLTADIDLGGEAWTPIGNTTNNDGTDAYSGTFDGGGHTISGLSVTGNFQHAGLFGITFNATIQNLSVAGLVSVSAQRAGGIVGSAACGTTIKNCSNHCNVSNLYPKYDPLTGGIAGAVYGSFEIPGHGDTPPTVYAGAAMIIDCYNTGSVHSEYGNSESGNPAIGGISGSNQGMIRNCYNVGSVSCSSQTAYIGSIVGFMPGWSSIGTVENCYYLDGTGLNEVGRSDREGNITKTEPKSAEEFADGTVLKALIDGRADGEHPWDTEGCKFLNDDIEMELPVLAWQKLLATPAVAFDTDGGSEVESQSVRRGSAVQEPAAPTKPGYTFAGWCTDADRTESYDFNTPVEESFTLYAKWTAQSYAIRYELDGGMVEGNPDSYTVETDTFVLNNPTKSGYIFTGWSGTGLTGEGNMSVAVEKGSMGDRVYTAHWFYDGAEAGGSSQVGDGGSSQVGGSSPRTGDDSNVLLWSGLLFTSACGLAVTTILGRRRREK